MLFNPKGEGRGMAEVNHYILPETPDLSRIWRSYLALGFDFQGMGEEKLLASDGVWPQFTYTWTALLLEFGHLRLFLEHWFTSFPIADLRMCRIFGSEFLLLS